MDVTLRKQVLKAVPYGYCQCGCGTKTRTVRQTDPRYGTVKGQPMRFVNGGHRNRHARPPIRYGKIDGEPVVYIPLTRGYWAIVDRAKLYLVKDGVWYYRNGYACQERDGKSVRMQNVIMPPPEGMITDHKFGKTLDNRCSQLRYATQIENGRNRKLSVNNTSGYKGVTWNRTQWFVAITVDCRRVYIGVFPKDQLIEAAKAYDKAALKYFGSFARLNFPEEG